MAKGSFTIRQQAKAINSALEKMREAVARDLVKGALEQAAKPIHDAARSAIPVRTGLLRDDLEVKVSIRKTSGGVARIGYAKGAKSRHAYWVEYGTAPRVREDGVSTGAMPAQPFLRPAFDRNKELALQIILRELSKGIENAAEGGAK